MKKLCKVLWMAMAAGACGGAAIADEGMWLLNAPPVAALKERYGFEPTAEWLEHMQKSAVRFNTGGSGSLVSANGLVMTNHHVGSDMLAKLSTPQRDLLKAGFHARSLVEELKCPDLELNILWSIEDVADRVKGGIAADVSAADAGTARRRRIAQIESEAREQSGLHCQVVTLYQGGQYHLYRYKRFTDVRLVWAPEAEVGFFGGDTDNFEFPRFNLDAMFFRIYENNQPLRPEHYLRWSADGSREGDLAFVFGHPGRTERLNTLDHVKFLRDVQTLTSLRWCQREEIAMAAFCARSAEHARQGSEYLDGVANGRKAYTGHIAGLQDPALIKRKADAEAALRAAADLSQGNDPWKQLRVSFAEYREFYPRHYAIGRIFRGELAQIAQHLLRLGDESGKPSAERLREYGDANRESLELALFSPAPIHDELEIEKLASAVSFLVESVGGDDPLVVNLLAGKSPRAFAEDAVYGTSLKSVEVRRAMAQGGKAAIDASRDPMIGLARALDGESRALRKRFEDRVESVQRESYAGIAATKFRAEGDKVYPDATFTLRMSFGPVKGYLEGGRPVAPYTTYAGLFQRHQDRKARPEFGLPERWRRAMERIDLNTPLNFVCTADIIGGNSGSPVVNREGEVIGLVFDGNIHSLVWALEYDDKVARAVSVDSRGIIEALRKVYDAGALADEIQGRGGN